MPSMQVTYHTTDGNPIREMSGFRFADGEMVDVTINEANAALLEEIRKDKAFTSEPAPLPPEPEPAPERKKDTKAESKKNQHGHEA